MPASKYNRLRRKNFARAKDPLADPNKEIGEGNYQATRDYNRATERFVKSGRVPDAARAAAPANSAEADAMQRAENVGRGRRKEEDPALLRNYRKRSLS